MAWTIRRKVLLNFAVVTGVLVVTGGLLVQAVASQIQQVAVNRTQDATADFVRQQAETSLAPEDFGTDFARNRETYLRFFREIDLQDIVRIKVWDLNATVVFSDDESIVGRAFPDNDLLRRAYQGAVTAEVQPPERPENVAEAGYAQLMEVYVPVTLQGRPAGVIETYTTLDRVNAEVRQSTAVLGSILGIALAAVVGTFLYHLWSLNRSVIRPVLDMRAAIQAVARGSLEVRTGVRSRDEMGELAASLNSMLDELQRLDRTKDQFIAIVSHELRTPLAVVHGYVSLLEDGSLGPLTETQREKLQAVLEQTRRLGDTIRTFLDVNAIRLGKFTVRAEPVDIGRVARDAVESVWERARAKGVQLNAYLSPSLPLVPGDAERLSSVFLNLLDNAVRHTPAGGTVLVTAVEKQGEVHVEVSDTGTGIPPYELHHVFDRFYQVEPHAREAPGSLGLGLTICRGIVEAHGGRIWAESTPGAGATFHFTLPVDRPGRGV